jgi:hypothetical protein
MPITRVSGRSAYFPTVPGVRGDANGSNPALGPDTSLGDAVVGTVAVAARAVHVGADLEARATHCRPERSATVRTAEAADPRRDLAEARVRTGDDVHHAADRVAAVHRGTGAAKDLDALDHRRRHREIERVVAALHVADPNAVDEHDDPIERGAAKPQVRLRRRSRLRVDAERE